VTGCEGARALVPAYVDGELVGEDLRAFESHLAGCPGCREALHAETAMAEDLGRSLAAPTAPPELRRRVADSIGAAERRRSWWWPAAAAAVVAAAGWVAVARPLPARPASELVSVAVDSHLRYARGQLPLEVRSDRAEEVSAFFAGRVPFHVVLPDYPAPLGESKPYALEGGRLVAMRGDYAAYVAYRMDGQPISLLVTSSSLATPAGGELVRSGALTFHLESQAGLNVITWTDNGLTYALASDVSVEGARSCLVCHGSREERRKIDGFGPRT
jgi:anti-sigma factor (TIGR02949 family)